MKREIEMYVDTFKEKSGKISCNVLYQGACSLMRDKSLNEYVEKIIGLVNNTLCDSDDEIKIYVDIRGIGFAMYDLLKEKYKYTYKLDYKKDYSIDMGSGWTTVNTIKADNIKGKLFIEPDPSHVINIHNDFVSEKDVEKIIDKKLNEKTKSNTEQFVGQMIKLAKVKF